MKRSAYAMWAMVAFALTAALHTGCTGEAANAEALAQLVGGSRTVAGAQTAVSLATIESNRDAAPAGGLQLSDEQKSQAAAIFQQLRTDLDGLRDATDAQIRAVLTEEQAAEFDQRPPRGRPGSPGGPGFGHGASADDVAAQTVSHVAALAKHLNLTADQQATISALLTDSRAKAAVLHDQAVADFRALLTADQQAKFDALQKDGRIGFGAIAGRGRPHDGPRGARLAEELNLTAEQVAQADAIRDQVRMDIDALQTAADEQIRALLTDEQSAKFDAHRPPAFDGPPPFGPRGRGEFGRALGRPGRGGPPPPIGFEGDKSPHIDRLADVLGLSDEQKASVTTILDDLQTAIKVRRDEARAAFRALLTADQIALLDAIEAKRD